MEVPGDSIVAEIRLKIEEIEKQIAVCCADEKFDEAGGWSLYMGVVILWVDLAMHVAGVQNSITITTTPIMYHWRYNLLFFLADLNDELDSLKAKLTEQLSSHW